MTNKLRLLCLITAIILTSVISNTKSMAVDCNQKPSGCQECNPDWTNPPTGIDQVINIGGCTITFSYKYRICCGQYQVGIIKIERSNWSGITDAQILSATHQQIIKNSRADFPNVPFIYDLEILMPACYQWINDNLSNLNCLSGCCSIKYHINLFNGSVATTAGSSLNCGLTGCIYSCNQITVPTDLLEEDPPESPCDSDPCPSVPWQQAILNGSALNGNDTCHFIIHYSHKTCPNRTPSYILRLNWIELADGECADISGIRDFHVISIFRLLYNAFDLFNIGMPGQTDVTYMTYKCMNRFINYVDQMKIVGCRQCACCITDYHISRSQQDVRILDTLFQNISDPCQSPPLCDPDVWANGCNNACDDTYIDFCWDVRVLPSQRIALPQGGKESGLIITSRACVYPNPANNTSRILIYSKSDFLASIKIIDEKGISYELGKVKVQQGEDIFTFDASSFKSGIYNFRIFTDNEVFVQGKFLIVH